MKMNVIWLFLAVISITQAAQINLSKLQASATVDEIANLLEKFSKAANDLNNEVKKIDFSKAGFVKYAEAAALRANERVLDLLKTLHEGTTDTGKIILDCFEAQNGTVEVDIDTAVTEIGECLRFDAAAVKWYMDQYIEGLEWVHNNLDIYADDLRACDNELAITCISEVINKNGLTLPTLIGFGLGRVAEITIGVVGGIVVVNDLKNCGEQVLQNHLEAYTKEIFNGAVSCIEKEL